MKSKVNTNIIYGVYIGGIILFYLLVILVAKYVTNFFTKKNNKEHFSVVFYGDKPKVDKIPANYPKYQRGPCLRKNKKGLVSWGNLTGEDPGNCDYHTDTPKVAPKAESTKTIKPNSLLDAQGNLKKGKINQLLGIVEDPPSSNSFCTSNKDLNFLNNKCQTLYPNLAPNVGVKEIESNSDCTSGDKVICASGYFLGNELSSPNAEVIGCNPISSNFNTLCQNKYGRRVGYKSVTKAGCKPGYQWAECSPLYYNGLPVYDRYIDGQDMKATLCYPDNRMDNFTQACQQFGSDWNIHSFVADYCKPGNLRALCSQTSTSPSSTPGGNGNSGSPSGTGPYLPNSCPCAS